MRTKPLGWRSNSYGHALASRGISTKRYTATKQILMDPVFYAQKHKFLPFYEVDKMAREGMTYSEMLQQHPDADKEQVRRSGINALESLNADGTLSHMDRTGVDEQVIAANNNPGLKVKMNAVLNDRQKVSFLHPIKADAIHKRLQD
jgi:hypothetical protein